MKDIYQAIHSHFSIEHDLILTNEEISELLHVINTYHPPQTEAKEDVIFYAVDSFRGDDNRWVVLKHNGKDTHYYRYDIVHKIIDLLQKEQG